jgi:hypothetical protein
VSQGAFLLTFNLGIVTKAKRSVTILLNFKVRNIIIPLVPKLQLGNAFRDALRPATRSVATGIPKLELGNEGKVVLE